ncbi:purine-binding chemotaxis protein CheW [bacterium AH-315-L15]|nr:purine-binding chemotaxis protein CheW [bacterium AH-315-L15]
MSIEFVDSKSEVQTRGGDRRADKGKPAGDVERRVSTADRRHENNCQYVTFYLGDHYLGVEVEKVQEVFTTRDMTGVPLAQPAIAGLINLRGHIIITIDLRKRLVFEERDSEENQMSIVIRTTEGQVNIIVDKIGGVVEVRPDLFESPPTNLEGQLKRVVKGIYKLEGQLLLTLHTELITQVDCETGPEQ